MLDLIKNRIEVLEKQLEQSAGNHNALLGAKQELEALYHAFTSAAPAVEAVVAVADPATAPALDAVVSTIESVA